MGMASGRINPAGGPKSGVGFYCAQQETANYAVPELADGPIIASVISPDTLETALIAPTRILYLLIGNPLTLPTYLKSAKDRGKLCIVNMDFVEV